MHIRPATLEDIDQIRRIECADAACEGCPPPEPAALLEYWFGERIHAYLAERDGQVIALYRVRPIRSEGGDHVANASFVVDPTHRGHGIGSALASHAVGEARRLGYRAMQFSFVPSTRAGAIALWRGLGFAIVGTLPGCYRDRERGDVDAFVLHRDLRES